MTLEECLKIARKKYRVKKRDRSLALELVNQALREVCTIEMKPTDWPPHIPMPYVRVNRF